MGANSEPFLSTKYKRDTVFLSTGKLFILISATKKSYGRSSTNLTEDMAQESNDDHDLDTFLLHGFGESRKISPLRIQGPDRSDLFTNDDEHDSISIVSSGVDAQKHLSQSLSPSLSIRRIDQHSKRRSSHRIWHSGARSRLGNAAPLIKLWNPFWLYKAVLVALIVLFGAIAIALIVLWRYSVSHQGFALITDNHYAWTYGPTAILVVVISLWRQVDFWCKALAPWKELSVGGATASKTLLLDYVSPFQLISLWQALMHRHYVVVASASGFLLLKLVIVFSTGLLTMLPTNVGPSTTSLVLKTKFTSSVNLTTVLEDPYTYEDPYPAYATFAIMSGRIPYVDGTTGQVAYQRFGPASNYSIMNSSITGEVDGFYPDFICEPAQIKTNMPPASSPYNTIPIDATSSSCRHPQSAASSLNLTTGLVERSVIAIYIKDPRDMLCPPKQLVGASQWVSCSEDELTSPTLQRMLLTLADFRYSQTLVKGSQPSPSNSVNTTQSSTRIEKVAGLICRPTYAMEKTSVTYNLYHDPVTTTVKGPLTHTKAKLHNFNDQNLTEIFQGTLRAGVGLGDQKDNDLSPAVPDAMFALISAAIGGDYEALFNTTIMQGAAEKVFQNVMVQVANKYLTKSVSDRFDGQLLSTENRLHIRSLSLWLMTGSVIAMIGLAILVLVRRPQDVVPRNPLPVSTIAMILSRSPGLQLLLQASGRLSTREMGFVLATHSFHTSIQTQSNNSAAFQIETDGQEEKEQGKLANTALKWWQPFPALWPVSVLTHSLPIVLIIALEFLQQVSDSRDGITTLSNRSSVAVSIYTRYLPALVMLLVASMYNSLDFSVASLAPFQVLKRGSVPATRSIMANLLGKMPLHGLACAFKHRYWSAVFAMTAALVGSSLTIIVSGLYIIENVEASSTITVARLDNFNTSWQNSVQNDSSAGVLLSLIESLDLPYPLFTYDGLVFPTVGLADTMVLDNVHGDQVPMKVQLPALRATLNCTFLSEGQFNYTSAFDGSQRQVNSLASAPLSTQCRRGGQGGNLSYIDWRQSWWSADGTSSISYAGSLQDLHVGPWDPSQYFDGSYGESYDELRGDNPPGCPSLAFTFGYFGDNNNSTAKVSCMICYQLMQEVQTEVTFLLPGVTISTKEPPVPDESSAKYLPSGSHGETAFEYRLEQNLEGLDGELVLFNTTSYVTANPQLIDPFFQTILYGRQPVEPGELIGRDNHGKLLNAIKTIYGRYMAQAISANMRVKLNNRPRARTASDTTTITHGSPSTLNGTLINPNLPRLKQNRASKLVLQILLGIMFVCGLVAYILADLRHTLSHDPCSIAGAASLLAGSEMCSESICSLLPDGVEFMSDEELQRNKVYDGWVFSLGLWDWRWGVQSRFGIDLGRAEKAG